MAQVRPNMAKNGKRKAPVPVRALRTASKTVGVGQAMSVTVARQLERRYQVLELRKMGCSQMEIAKTLGCAPETVAKDLEAVFSQTAECILDSAAVERDVEIARFDALLKRYQPLAEAGNLAAAGMVLSISDRKRKLLALDKPEVKREAEETAIRVYVGINVDDV